MSKRIKYTDRYHSIRELIASSSFREWHEDILVYYEGFEYPLPDTNQQNEPNIVNEWIEGMWNTREKLINSKRFIDAKLSFLEEHKNPTMNEFDNFVFKYIPEPIGAFISNILIKCKNFSHQKDKEEIKIYKKYILEFLLTGKKEYQEPFYIREIRNYKGEIDLYIKILPHTKKEDINSHWKDIAIKQKKLKGYKSNYDEKKNTERDVLIFELYKKYKDIYSYRKEMEKYNIALTLAGKISLSIEEQYGDVSEGAINKVINNKKKQLQS